MRIGFLIYHRIDGRGGLENALLKTISHLEKQGNETTVFFWENTIYPEFLNNFKQTYIINPLGRKIVNHSFLPKFINRRLQKNYDYKQMAHFFKEKIASLNLDILIVIDLPDTLVQFLPILTQYKQDHKTAIVTWIHGSVANPTPKQIKRIKQLMPVFDQHLTVSKGITTELQQIYHIHNAIPVQNPIDPAEIIPRGKNNFIYIGRIGDPRKQVDRLIDALPALKGDWTLDIYGSMGSKKKDLQFLQKIEDLALQQNIIFHGWSNNPWESIKCADLLLLNSYTEGFGLVLAEAMMRGIPCISSDCPVGPREIIQTDINGWLFDVGREEILIQMLQEIIDNQRQLPDAEMIKKTVLHYQTDIVTQDFKEKLELAIQKAKN